MVEFPGKRFFVLKAVADESAGRQSERASTAGSAKPCLSPLCQLSTLGYISAMWSGQSTGVPLIPG